MKCSLLCFTALLSVPLLPAAELVIAADKTCDYQIVIPDKTGDQLADGWLLLGARLTQAALAKNGFEVPISSESTKSQDKPGLYLGATQFAKAQGVSVDQLQDWTYYQKVVGRDVIIAGHDRRDPMRGGDGREIPVALLGTIKGVCDFLREHAGVRFLFINHEPALYPSESTSKRPIKDDGPLQFDTRSIAILPVEKITLPADLDLKKTPLMVASYDNPQESLFKIANNFFPRLGSLQGGEVRWYDVLPTEKYGKTHPEYFALTKDGRRACELKVGFDHYMQYCPTNPGVQDLMFAETEKQIAAGHKIIHLAGMDAYRLCQCNCDDCNKLFGRKAMSWEETRARGDSGKLWQAFFRITERARAQHPDVRFVVLNYQDTPVSAKVIQRFPDNVIVNVQFASQRDFDRLAGVEFPAGICGFEETFTGFGQAGPYIAERTPEHMAEVVKTIARNKVKWSHRDGVMGYVRGIQAPAYYVYGRMMDDPTADWQKLMDEFCVAAFGEVKVPMAGFFEALHAQTAIYSDYFGVFMAAWDRKYSRSRYHDSKWHVMSIYTPEFCADADTLLTRAEAGTQDADVLARLHLIRIEFDYARQLSRIFYLQNAWTMNPTQVNLDPLMDAIDAWHASLEKLTGGRGRTSIKALSDWPQMVPLGGHQYTHVALEHQGYQQQWDKTCINWDTEAIRAGVLSDPHELKVASVEAEPVIDAKAWETAPESSFRLHDSMPFANLATRMKLLRDKTHLYVRVESLHPLKHPEDFYQHAPDTDTFTQEYVELVIAPPDAGGKVYRFAANPVAGSRYDAVYTPVKKSLSEDKAWNGTWQFRFAVTGKKGQYTLPDRMWTAWFKIPFTDLGTTPQPGAIWGFNAGRGRNGQSLLWLDALSGVATRELGKLEF
ncbi:DUF4838 domain-containing protein [Prosthecobacter sp.]|uniref:DUF4838 domain-containing protein n=1 Tax=Prosthecobacter sp. TaxID=1965333 RepID=UPI002487811B|nr:DUF4838 domain-containing protein [Prosthecobacter sp.]MDI1311019.1 DUF4838 domain-containing protein [Prosthecobacter sp.]